MNFDTEIIKSTIERAEHIAKSVSWFSKELSLNNSYQEVFSILVGAVAEARTSAQVSGIKHQLICIGVGKSGHIASLIANMFVSVGVFARFLHPSEAIHGDIGAVCEHDTILCISNNGNSQEILSLIPKLRERSCRIFGITAVVNSPFAKLCDYVLPLPLFEEACAVSQVPITSTVTTLAFCQLVVAASIEHRSFDIENYARNHPGGSIGKKIYLKVDDLMIKGKSLPVVAPNTTFPECISSLTRNAMSVVLVAEDEYLKGIISEKDIRVAMEKYNKMVFEKFAFEFMNATPITIEQNMLAVDALKIMKNRAQPLNFLPIVDKDHRIKGLLRLHELVNAGIILI